MRLDMNTIRDQQNSTSPIFSNFTNRINYLQQKNQSVNKKLLSYMNCFQRRLLSERSHNSESKDKNSYTFRIHPSKKFNLKDEPGRFVSENTAVSKGPKMAERNYKTEQESKENFLDNSKRYKIKKEIGFQLNKLNSRNKEPNNGVINLENLKKGKRFLQKVDDKKPLNRSLANQKQQKIVIKTDNFLKTLTKITKDKSPYTQIWTTLSNRKGNKKPDQQKLKLIEIKKKLLEEEEKSLMEYQKCILYKQKLAQKIKHQNAGQGTNGSNGSENKRPYEQSEVFIYAEEEDS